MPPPRQPNRRGFGWEALLLAVPVVALLGFGVLSLGWEKRSQREELRMRCVALADPLRDDFLARLEGGNVLADFAGEDAALHLPVPEEPGDSLASFRDGDYSAVLGGAQTRSEVGLPLRPLAALRLLRAEVDPKRLEELTAVMASERSLLTPRLLAEAEERHAALGLPLPAMLEGWEERVRRQEAFQDLLETEGPDLLAPAQMMRWVASGDRSWFVLRATGGIMAVDGPLVEEAVAASVAPIEASLPAGVAVEVVLRGAESSNYPVLVEVAGTPSIRFVVADAAALHAVSSGRRVVFRSFLGLAAGLAVVGIVLLSRTVARERELSDRKSNLVAAVSHEMRTPVASIRLLAENLAGGAVREGVERERHLARLVEQSERLSTLVGNVLSYSRREAGKADVSWEEIVVEDMLREGCEQVEALAAEKRVAVTCAAGEFARPPKGDRASLREGLVNLLDNALKYSPEGGVVVCGAEPDPGRAGRWRLWVEDGGPGVKREERTKIFEAFYRVGSELCRETAGTGLGLALVRQVAELHGGEARCREAPAGGARFELNLPLDPARAS